MVVVHGFVVTIVLGGHLGLEAGGLFLGVIQLRETIAEFAARDVELKALGHARLVVAGTRQRRDFHRVFADEGGLPQLFFHGFFKVHDLQAGQRTAGELVLGLGQAEFAQRVDEPGGVVHLHAQARICLIQEFRCVGVLADGFMDGQALKWLG
ncbi:MAG: hypothetical protein ACD_23C00658G0002 [uncultured bacterium]|nr:MAG: hypothetical protein ACD_23C00658G0002 [uncultured bacterium]